MTSFAPAPGTVLDGQGALRTYEFVVNAITDPVAVIDDSLHYRVVNDAWCAMTGLSRSAVIGQPAEVVFPQAASPERRRAIRECIDLREPRMVRGPGPSGAAAGLVLETRLFPYADAQLAWHGAVMISRDITAIEARQAELSASVDNLQLTLNTTGDAIFATEAANLDEPVLFVNDQLLKLWGIPAERAGSVTGSMIVEHASQHFVDPQHELARIGEIIAGGASYEDRLVLRDGRVLVRRCIPASRNGRALRVWGFRDVTAEARAMQQALAARDEADRANRAKSQFLANMSHELRTPLNAVLGFGHLLQRNASGNLTDKQLRQIHEIERAGEHLLALIDDLLDVSRLEAGQVGVEIGPVPLAALIDDCLALMRPLAERHAVGLDPPPATNLVVSADPARLKQVLLNLLSNAVKHNRPGGRVTLGYAVEGQAVRLDLRDTGLGLDEQALARLFRPFERLDTSHSAVAGAGIGLALSSQLMRLMRGEIGVDSQPGVGSRFWIRLPLAATSEAAERGAANG